MKCGGLYVAGGEVFKVIGQRGAGSEWRAARGGADRGVPGRQCGCAVVAEVCGRGDERAARGQMYTGAGRQRGAEGAARGR